MWTYFRPLSTTDRPSLLRMATLYPVRSSSLAKRPKWMGSIWGMRMGIFLAHLLGEEKAAGLIVL